MVRSEMAEQVAPLISSGISHCVPARTLIFDPKDHYEALLLLPSEIAPFFAILLQYDVHASFALQIMRTTSIQSRHYQDGKYGVDRRAKWHNLEV